MELIQAIQEQRALMYASLDKLLKNGIAASEAQKKYELKKTAVALELKEQEMPVTFMNQIIHGIPEVAELRFEKNVAQANYETNLEYIKALKLDLRILEANLEREWGNTK